MTFSLKNPYPVWDLSFDKARMPTNEELVGYLFGEISACEKWKTRRETDFVPNILHQRGLKGRLYHSNPKKTQCPRIACNDSQISAILRKATVVTKDDLHVEGDEVRVTRGDWNDQSSPLKLTSFVSYVHDGQVNNRLEFQFGRSTRPSSVVFHIVNGDLDDMEVEGDAGNCGADKSLDKLLLYAAVPVWFSYSKDRIVWEGGLNKPPAMKSRANMPASKDYEGLREQYLQSMIGKGFTPAGDKYWAFI